MVDDRCQCGLPSINGLHASKCQRHYNESQWGKQWANTCVEGDSVIVRDHRTNHDITYMNLYIEEAVRNAYAQYEKNDFNTWDYAKYNKEVSRIFSGRIVAGEMKDKKPQGVKSGPVRFSAKERKPTIIEGNTNVNLRRSRSIQKHEDSQEVKDSLQHPGSKNSPRK